MTLARRVSLPSWPWPTCAKLLALFLLILGAKLCLMRADSTALPFFDQWEAEGQNLLQPYQHGTLRLADLFAAHNGHRILWTRLLVLGVFRLNGQWDAQVEMIAAAVLHALIAVGLGAVLIRGLGRAAEDKILLCLGLLFSLPFGWENTLSGGFQSQYYFLILFGGLTVWGLGLHRLGAVAWWLGAAAGVAVWFTDASGWFAGVAVVGWMVWQLVLGGGRRRDHWITLAVAILLTAGGLACLLGVGSVGGDLRARSAGEFLWKLLGLLGWPNPTPWAALPAYAPLVWLVCRRVRNRASADPRTDGFLLPFGAFIILQAAGMAYARNHFKGLEVSRYMDFLSLGALVNFACLLVCVREVWGALRPAGRRWLGACQLGWGAVFLLGLCNLTEGNLQKDLPFIRLNNTSEERNIPAFIAAPGPAHFEGKTPFDFQCSKPGVLRVVLTDPAMLAVLPPVARRPLPLVPTSTEGALRKVGVSVSEGVPEATGWLLAPPQGEQKLSRFRGGTLRTNFPWLSFRVSGAVGASAYLCLVGERSGAVTWVLPEANASEWDPVRVPAPDEPFHVEAAVRPGARKALAFLEPVEVGSLSARVEGWFGWSLGLVFAGAGMWLAVVFCGVSPAEAKAEESDASGFGWQGNGMAVDALAAPAAAGLELVEAGSR